MRASAFLIGFLWVWLLTGVGVHAQSSYIIHYWVDPEWQQAQSDAETFNRDLQTALHLVDIEAEFIPVSSFSYVIDVPQNTIAHFRFVEGDGFDPTDPDDVNYDGLWVLGTLRSPALAQLSPYLMPIDGVGGHWHNDPEAEGASRQLFAFAQQLKLLVEPCNQQLLDVLFPETFISQRAIALGNCALISGRVEDAISAYEQCVLSDGRHCYEVSMPLAQNLAWAYLRVESGKTAFAVMNASPLQELLRWHSGLYDTIKSLTIDYALRVAQIHVAAGDDVGALYFLMKAFALTPEILSIHDRVVEGELLRVLLYFERARVYMRMSRWDDALADLDAALEIDSENPALHVERARVLDAMARWRSLHRG